MKQRLLAYLQRLLRTDIRYLLRGGFWVGISYTVQVVSGIALTLALANWLPKETLGTYQFVLAVAGVLSVCTLSGVGKAVVRAVAQGREGAFLDGVYTKLRWNGFIVLGSGAVAAYYFINGNAMLGTSFLLVGATTPIIEAAKLYHDYLQGKQAFRDQVMLGFWRRPIPLVVLLITLYFTNDVVTILAAYFVSNALATLLVYWLVIKKYRPPHTTDREMVSYSKHLSVLAILGKVGAHADKILLWHFLGPVAVASFTIARLTTKYTAGTFRGLSTVILPKLAQRDLATLQQTLHRKVALLTIALALLAAAYAALLPPLFSIFLPDYTESIALAQVLAITIVLSGRNIYGQALVAHKQLRAQYATGPILQVLKVLLLVALIPLYGIWGAVYALLIAEVMSFMVQVYFFNRAR